MKWKEGILIALISGIVGYLLHGYFSLGSLELPFINGLWIALSFLLGLLGGSDIVGFISNYYKERNEKRAIIRLILSEIELNQDRLRPLSDATKVLDGNEEVPEENVFPNELNFNDKGFSALQNKIGLLNKMAKIYQYYNELDVIKKGYPKLNIHESFSRKGQKINRGLPLSYLVILEFNKKLGKQNNLSEIEELLRHAKRIYGLGEELIIGLEEEVGIKPSHNHSVGVIKEPLATELLRTKTPGIRKLWFDFNELKSRIFKDKRRIKEYIEKEYGGLPPDFEWELRPDKKKKRIYELLEEFYKKGNISENGKIKNSKEFVETIVKDKPLCEIFRIVFKSEDDLYEKTNEIEQRLKKIAPDFEKNHNELKYFYDKLKS